MLIVSPQAEPVLRAAGVDVQSLLERFQAGDWGDDDPMHRSAADFCAANALPVISHYSLPTGAVIVLIATADRSETHVLTRAESEPIEVSVTQGYAAWSRTYDAELNQLIILEQTAVARLLAPLRVEAALDAATGTGRHALALSQRGASVTAFDTSPEMLAVARAAARASDLPIAFVQASLAGPLPFRSERFDLVVCGLAFCHLADLRMPCHEFYRLARRSGQLLLTDFHPDVLAHGWRTVMWYGHRQYLLPNFPHGRAGYLAAVEEAGFRLRAVEDLPIAALPPEASHPELLQRMGNVNLCLAVLAEKV